MRLPAGHRLLPGLYRDLPNLLVIPIIQSKPLLLLQVRYRLIALFTYTLTPAAVEDMNAAIIELAALALFSEMGDATTASGDGWSAEVDQALFAATVRNPCLAWTSVLRPSQEALRLAQGDLADDALSGKDVQSAVQRVCSPLSRLKY